MAKSLVKTHSVLESLKYDDNILVWAGQKVTDIAAHVGQTPFFAYDSDKMTNRVAELRAAGVVIHHGSGDLHRGAGVGSHFGAGAACGQIHQLAHGQTVTIQSDDRLLRLRQFPLECLDPGAGSLPRDPGRWPLGRQELCTLYWPVERIIPWS